MTRLAELALAHLSLSLWALMLGAAISLPLGVAAARRPSLERVVLGAASVIQTIPGLALLAVMVPALASFATVGLELPAIGALPAVLGLTLYSLLPMLRNTVVGLSEVDPAVKEAARGVGMTPRQQLRLVELPLALPVIVAGLRTATVWTVGMATLATPIGASSLGDLIFAGLQTRDHRAVLLGCVASAGLALGLDGLIRAIERGVRRRRRALWIPATVVLGGLCAHALASPVIGAFGGPRPVRIGAKPFTEQYVLGELLAQRIERETDREPRVLRSLGSHVAFDALVAGDLDLYVEYTGTVWTAQMGREAPPADRAALAAEVERWLRETHGVVVVARLGFENAYALAARAPSDGGPSVDTIGQLAARAPDLTVAGDYELFRRGEWRALESTYGLRFAEERTMDPALLYEALAAGEVDVIGAYTTDGRLAAHHLRVLEDERGAIPPYDAVILANRDFAAASPEVITALRALDGALDDEAMRALNRAVDLEGEPPEAAARAWLDARSTDARPR
ncbi:MAG TPA: ABC transporter permease/substrate-binding protein [Sandaracinaceae bacterium LLY-WYZ-13_1]|nr:ABC transporter permease/substrate-binding protein [Sandaracinaceae bacterium LLY-WYZ-13_1]